MTFECEMLDGSIFKMPHPEWNQALEMKYDISNEQIIKELKYNFVNIVKEYWENKTEPTKFSFNNPWEHQYQDHANLGVPVMYQYIRAPLMGIAMQKLLGDKGSIVGVGADKITQYDGKSAKEIRHVDEITDKVIAHVEDEE